MEHSASFAPFGARFMDCCSFGDFYVMGDVPTDGDGAKLRAGLAALNAKFLVGFASLRRTSDVSWRRMLTNL